MNTITDIKLQTKNKNRANIFLDGCYFCALELETIYRNQLKIGKQIDKEEISKIQLQSEKSRAKEKAYSLIEKKFYTEKELAKKLKEKGFLDATIREVISDLKGYNFVNDNAYARTYVSQSTRLSRRNLQQKLRIKGIDAENIEEAISRISDLEEIENCKYFAEKFWHIKAGVVNAKQKLIAHLVGKGFEYETIKKVVRELTNNEEDL